MSDKAKYGYLAGIIDGEGCITIGAGRRNDCINYNAIILVQNTSKELIDWLQKYFGGYVYLSKKETDKNKAAWMWRITKQKEVELILLAVLPYLVIKREQAKILLSFVRLPSGKNPEVRGKLYNQIRLLNTRGKSVTTNTQDLSKYKNKCECGNPQSHKTFICPAVKIESDLNSDIKSDPVVKQEAVILALNP